MQIEKHFPTIILFGINFRKFLRVIGSATSVNQKNGLQGKEENYSPMKIWRKPQNLTGNLKGS